MQDVAYFVLSNPIFILLYSYFVMFCSLVSQPCYVLCICASALIVLYTVPVLSLCSPPPRLPHSQPHASPYDNTLRTHDTATRSFPPSSLLTRLSPPRPARTPSQPPRKKHPMSAFGRPNTPHPLRTHAHQVEPKSARTPASAPATTPRPPHEPRTTAPDGRAIGNPQHTAAPRDRPLVRPRPAQKDPTPAAYALDHPTDRPT